MLYTTFLLLFIPLTCCLRITDLYVPNFVDVRSQVELRCTFDIENYGLQSVKWYKDDQEFFRYAPSYQSPLKTFAAKGIHVMEHRSNMSMVTLYPLEYSSSGRYQCEVSTEAPHFKVVNKSANMTVLGMPRTSPRLDGVDRDFSLLEYLAANCTSAPSKPPAVISWLINDEQAEDWLLENYRIPPSHDKYEMEARVVGLRFQLGPQYFQRRYLNLSCVASVQGLNKTTSITIVPVELKNQMYAQGHKISNDVADSGKMWSNLLNVLLMFYVTKWFL